MKNAPYSHLNLYMDMEKRFIVFQWVAISVSGAPQSFVFHSARDFFHACNKEGCFYRGAIR